MLLEFPGPAGVPIAGAIVQRIHGALPEWAWRESEFRWHLPDAPPFKLHHPSWSDDCALLRHLYNLYNDSTFRGKVSAEQDNRWFPAQSIALACS
jgi:hypothetical protein